MTKRILSGVLLCMLVVLYGADGECAASGKILINEVFVDGSSNYPDWIELYNSGDTACSLKGYRLSDNPDEPGWTIAEAFIINPGEHSLFICDKRNAHDHTNFRLKSIGGQVYLFDPSGELADQITYSGLPRFSSIGRYPDGGAQWFIHATPTMGGENGYSQTPVARAASSASLHISHASGIYDEPFTLTMQPPPGISVRYTLDGSIPDMSSKLYGSGIPIESTAVIRIAQVDTLGAVGKPVTRSYFIKESTTLPIVSVVTDPKNLWDQEVGIYADGDSINKDGTQSQNWRHNWRRPVDIEFITRETQWSVTGESRVHGGASRGRPQKSLAFYSGDKETPYGIRHRLFPAVQRTEYAGFILRNGGDAWLRTQFRDAFQQALVQDRAEVESMRYRPVVVFINGAYWGVYGLRESIIKKNLLAGRELPLQPTVVLEGGEIASDKGPFADFRPVSAEGDYRLSLPSMDMDSYLDYIAIELYSGNPDWPDGNIKCWRPLADQESQWRWILYDLDRGFNGKRGKSPQEDPFEELLKRPGPRGLHFADMIQNRRFVRDFCCRLTAHILTTFQAERALSILDSMAQTLRPEMERHWQRWRWSWQIDRLFMNTDRWDGYLAILRDYCEQRPAAMMQIMDKRFKTGNPVPTSVAIGHTGQGRILVEGLELPDGRLTGPIPENLELVLEALPAPGYAFAGWTDDQHNTTPYITLKPGTSITDSAVFVPIDNKE
ncbi:MULTISPECIES: CotH kinase family protein [unclassified Pseudodesulfovibrio]|uniref:CotH kinase family protein n=1 Tax=unclassified Pseudodesulfovibrio TaxID=2661612 RepID=UPI0013E2DB12|nr:MULTISPECIES: CotH kinase family protein [unclassified Pseudodesulfovibrio]MCJ2166203.1 CotH kinase family protein [Pseudodesulfovibrio sp. S3-i]